MDQQQKHRRHFTPEQKLQVVLESIQRDTTLEAVSRKYSIVSSVIIRWRKEFKEKAAVVFSDKRNPKGKAIANGYKPGESPDELKRIIGDLTVQNEILKKVPGLLG
jgi:putative transposase